MKYYTRIVSPVQCALATLYNTNHANKAHLNLDAVLFSLVNPNLSLVMIPSSLVLLLTSPFFTEE